MLYGVFIIVSTFLISEILINKMVVVKDAQSLKDNVFLKKLFLYHLFLSIVYYTYAAFNPSDSQAYYDKVLSFKRGLNWSDFYGTSTTFIEWTGYPFIHFLGFSYEAMMALFSFFGFVGFIFFFKFFRERVKMKILFMGYDLLILFFLLPNLHFWSGSFGKGSFIFLGIAMLFYGMNNIPKRWIILFVGALLTYHIRPHILLVILVSGLIGFTFSSKGVGLGVKVVMILIAVAAFFYIYQDVLAMVGIEEDELLTEGLDLSHRASELSKASSGVDINNYSLPMQLFTFLYRPLFFDATGMLAIIVSFENIFLLLVTIRFVNKGGIAYVWRGDFLIKTAFLSFITVSVALAQISGNLGIAIRQKSQIMMLFLFVILCFLQEIKLKEYKRKVMFRKFHQKANA